jgi:chromosome segregation ATPase
MATPQARFDITAENKTRRAISSAQRQLQDFSDRAGRTAATIAKVGGAATAAAGGMAYLVDRTLDQAQQLENLSKQTGFSVERIQELRFAAKSSGVEVDEMDSALAELSQRMGEAAADGGEMAEGFKQAGIQIDGLTKRDPAAVFGDVADAIRDADSAADAAAIAVKVFGEEEGRRILPLLREGAGRMQELTERAREMGIVMDQETVQGASAAAEQLDTLKGVLSTQFTKAIAQLGPDIAEFTGELAENPEVVKEFVSDLGDLAEQAVNVGKGFAFLAEHVEGGLRVLGALETDEFSKLTNEMDRLREVQAGFLEDLQDAPKEGSFGDIFFASRKDLESDINAINKRLVELGKRRQELLEERGEIDDVTPPDISLSGDNAGGIEDTGDDADEAADKVEKFDGEVKKANESLKVAFTETKTYRDELRRLIDELEPGQARLRDYFDSMQLIEQSDLGAERKAELLAKLHDQLEANAEATKDLEDESKQAFGGMSQYAIQARRNIQSELADTLVQTMQGSYDSILEGWTRMLQQMVAEAAAAEIMGSLTGEGQEGEGLLGMAAQWFGTYMSSGSGGGAGTSQGLFGAGAVSDPTYAGNFATGGSFTVGGVGGTDSQLVAMRATPGERVTVQTPEQQRRGGDRISVNVTVAGGGRPEDNRRSGAQAGKAAARELARARDRNL